MGSDFLRIMKENGFDWNIEYLNDDFFKQKALLD
jgi:hypothetical protein